MPLNQASQGLEAVLHLGLRGALLRPGQLRSTLRRLTILHAYQLKHGSTISF